MTARPALAVATLVVAASAAASGASHEEYRCWELGWPVPSVCLPHDCEIRREAPPKQVVRCDWGPYIVSGVPLPPLP